MKPHRQGEYANVKNRQRRKARRVQVRKVKRTKPVKKTVEEPAAKPLKSGIRITARMLERARYNKKRSMDLAQAIFAAAKPMPGVVPEGEATIAMDTQISQAILWASQSIYNGAFTDGVTFLGYAYLSELAQRAEYRRVSEVIATEMTRKWIKIESSGDPKKMREKAEEKEDESAIGQDAPPLVEQRPAEMRPPAPSPEEQAEEEQEQAEADAKQAEIECVQARIKELEKELERLNVQEIFKQAALNDGLFGRAHLYIDTGATDMPDELKVPIGDGENEITKLKIKKGSIKRLKIVEPVWCYPASYNANDPLQVDWYKPQTWFVQGKEVHHSRLLTFVGRPVPDMLKPAYAFGGLSLSQMVMPCVQNWLRTRQSVSDLIKSFSVFVLKTGIQSSLQADGEQMFERADFFNQVRDNNGLMMIDKDEEDFLNVSTSLGSLDKLQAQSQEHICSVSGIPLVKYTGIAPSGLNASGDSEIRVFYDWIHAFQISYFSPNLKRIFHLAQMNIWGEVDPTLSFSYEPLWQLTEKEEAEVRKMEAETDNTLINAGVLDPAESRQRIANDKDTPYGPINVSEMPEPPAPEEGDPFGQGQGFNEEQGAETERPGQPDGGVEEEN